MKTISKENHYLIGASGGAHQRRGKSLGAINSSLFSNSEQAVNRQSGDFRRHQSYENQQNKSQVPSSLGHLIKKASHNSSEDMLLSPGNPYQFTQNTNTGYVQQHQTLESLQKSEPVHHKQKFELNIFQQAANVDNSLNTGVS